MVEFFKFQWLCAKEAWRGSFDLANAWYGLWGPVIIWLGSYWWGHPLTLPDKLDGYAIGLVFAFLGATWVGLLIARFFSAPARLYWNQFRNVRALEANIVSLKAAGDGSNNGPNWSILDLFTHIDPDFLSRADDGVGSRWDEVGNDIRDQAAVGRLRIWGRTTPQGADGILGQRPTLRLIEPNYWTMAFFTYRFFVNTAGDAPHTYLEMGRSGVEYTDLQVNRAEVLKLWPGEPDDLAEGYPNVRLADSPAAVALFEGSERAKIIALLMQEKILSWARVSASVSHDFVLLAGNVWGMSAFRCDPKNHADAGSINQTYLRQRNTPNAAFYDVCMNFAQLKRAWPSLEIRRTKCDVL